MRPASMQRANKSPSSYRITGELFSRPVGCLTTGSDAMFMAWLVSTHSSSISSYKHMALDHVVMCAVSGRDYVLIERLNSGWQKTSATLIECEAETSSPAKWVWLESTVICWVTE